MHRWPRLCSVVIAAATLAACGGSDSASTTTAPPVSSAPADTTSPSDSAAPETTAAAAETTEGVDSSTPMEFVEFASDDLVAALPAVADLGDGWTDQGGTPLVNPEGAEGLGVGSCGGPNGAARAATTGATAVVQGPIVLGPDERRASTSLYAFPDDITAQAFLDLTAQTISCGDGVTWDWIQKSNPVAPNEYNGFGPGFEDITENQIWHFTEVATSEYSPDGDDIVLVTIDRSRELTAANVTFSQVDTTLTRFDRYDNVVIVTQVSGSWDHKGYVGVENIVQFHPVAADLDSYTEAAQRVVLSYLGQV